MDRTKLLLPAIIAGVIFVSCTGNPGRRVLNFTETPVKTQTPSPFIINDYKDKANGGVIPEWVLLWLNSGTNETGIHRIEAMDEYPERYVFIHRNEGNNFIALTQWSKGFLPELDFPRLAAARIEARFSTSVPFPDYEYGAFYDALIRAASDAPWKGAVREDDFWIRREYIYSGEEDALAAGDDNLLMTGQGPPPIRESWEFLILVTMENTLFTSQLNEIFSSVKPSPQPSREQISAANKVKDRFFEGF